MQTSRLIIVVVFLATSSVLTLFTLYSANAYTRVYETLQAFEVSTPEIKVIILNASQASTETTMTLRNPSRSKVELVQVSQGMYLNDQFMAIGSLSTSAHPEEIQPMSNKTIVIKTDIPPDRVHFLTSEMERTWIVSARIVLITEIVGKFSWRKTWSITDV